MLSSLNPRVKTDLKTEKRGIAESISTSSGVANNTPAYSETHYTKESMISKIRVQFCN